jgi:hypothetical protein
MVAVGVSLQRVIAMKEKDIAQLTAEKDRLNRIIELRDARIETLSTSLRVTREERDKYRESLGDLMSAIDQWKIKTGLY